MKIEINDTLMWYVSPQMTAHKVGPLGRARCDNGVYLLPDWPGVNGWCKRCSKSKRYNTTNKFEEAIWLPSFTNKRVHCAIANDHGPRNNYEGLCGAEISGRIWEVRGELPKCKNCLSKLKGLKKWENSILRRSEGWKRLPYLPT